MVICIHEKEFRSQLVKKMIRDFNGLGISMTRISMRTQLHRTSLYKILKSKSAPNEKSTAVLANFYMKMVNDQRYMNSEYYLKMSNEIYNNMSLIRETVIQ